MKHFLLSLTLAAFGTAIFAPTAMADYEICEKNGKYGYADESGNVVIKPDYTSAMPFENGLAKVCKKDKWGMIDQTGKVVVKCDYDVIDPFENGLARVRKNGKFGYVRQDGTIYLKPEWDFIGTPNEEGWCWVAKGTSLDKALKGLYRNGVKVLACSYNEIGFYINTPERNFADGDWVYVKSDCNEITRNFTKLSPSDIPYIWVGTLNSKCMALYDLNGKQVVKPMYYSIGAPMDGYALIAAYNKDTDLRNFISVDGKNKKLFITDIFKDSKENAKDPCLAPFNQGMAMRQSGKDYFLIDTNGNPRSENYALLTRIGMLGYQFKTKSGKYGIISPTGKVTVEPIYSYIARPAEGETIFGARNADTKMCGFIDHTGTVVIPFEYTSIGKYSNGLAYAKKSTGWGLIDKDNRALINFEHKDIVSNLNFGQYQWCQSPADEKWYCYDITNGKKLFNQGYHETYMPIVGETDFFVVGLDKKYGIVTFDGVEAVPMSMSSAGEARKMMEYGRSLGKKVIKEIDIHRYKLYNNPDRNKHKLTQRVSSEMWDY